MKNEFGAKLDSNGYAPSIVDSAAGCFWCGGRGDTARHEPFGGAYRQKSKRLGLWVKLCPSCHQYAPTSAHQYKRTADALRAECQKAAMTEYGWSAEEFRKEFGKNFL